jgi:hypothetical protein
VNRPSVAYLHSQRESKRSKGKVRLFNGDILGGRSIEYRRNHVSRPSAAYPHSQRESKRSKGKIVFVFLFFKGDILGFLSTLYIQC